MAFYSLYPYKPTLHFHSHSQSHSHFSVHTLSSQGKTRELIINENRGRRGSFVVFSTHSNAKILKFNRKSRYGRNLSLYDSDEEEDHDDGDELADDDWLFDDEFAEPAEFEINGKIFKSQRGLDARQGSQKILNGRTGKNTPEKSIVGDFHHAKDKTKDAGVLDDDDGVAVAEDDWLLNDKFAEPGKIEVNRNAFNSQKRIHKKQGSRRQLNIRTGKNTQEKSYVGNIHHAKNKTKQADSLAIDSNEKLMMKKPTDNRYEKLYEEIDLDDRWIPVLDYLSTFGLEESDFVQMYERHMPSLQMHVCSAQERLEYLLSVGVRHTDIRRILLRQPQILEYTVENNLKSHVDFLKGLGIPDSKLGQIIAVAPSLFSYSVENSLKPTVRYLVEEVGINEKNIGKVVQLSPQILVQRADISWNSRYIFLSKELGASRDSVLKMVTKHPQLLHYSIDGGLLPRINFLRSIGMRNSDILKVLTSLTQVFSLSLEDNLRPKYMYLVNELRNEVQSLTKYPMYLSLSLDQRIRPRHRYLVSLNKAPKGPFPLRSLVPTDECFCQQWAGTSLDKYLEFRQQLLLKEFARKYER